MKEENTQHFAQKLAFLQSEVEKLYPEWVKELAVLAGEKESVIHEFITYTAKEHHQENYLTVNIILMFYRRLEELKKREKRNE